MIGEVKYNDPEMARTIAEFAQTAEHHVEEVMEFPAITNGVGGQSRCIDPPYRMDAYANALWGSPPSSKLSATVTDKTSFLTPQGRRVTALASGSYSISVDDKSKTRGFSFAGRSTAKKFRGRVTWRITLAPEQYSTALSQSLPAAEPDACTRGFQCRRPRGGGREVRAATDVPLA